MNERIKEVRKKLDISQADFGNKIGIGQAGVSAIENGIRRITERNIQLICEKFSVNESWLRTGKGEMFEKIPEEDEYFKAVTQISKSQDDIVMQAIIEYWKLDDASKKAIQNYIKNLAESITKK